LGFDNVLVFGFDELPPALAGGEVINNAAALAKL
jgi:hypothetical protein